MSVSLELLTGKFSGAEVFETVREIKDLGGIFGDHTAYEAMNPNTQVYRVENYHPVPEGQEGGILCATTFLAPGTVGDEYFMTRGHFHVDQDRDELCVTVSGQGALILMTRDRRTWIEPMQPNTINYISKGIAHRVANIGDTELVFTVYWPSDTGHDYETIAREGFSARLKKVDGKPALAQI